MWPFSMDAVQVKTPDAVEVPETKPESNDEEIIIPEYGSQAAGLTQFGTLWVRLEDVSCVDFDPEDGCAGEIEFRSGESWHLSDETAAALKAYLLGIGNIK